MTLSVVANGGEQPHPAALVIPTVGRNPSGKGFLAALEMTLSVVANGRERTYEEESLSIERKAWRGFELSRCNTLLRQSQKTLTMACIVDEKLLALA